MTRGRFRAGNIPANKGRKRELNEASRANCFKAGATAPNKLPVGTERLKRGMVMRKVHDDRTAPLRQWDFVHLINWRLTHGEIPAGQVLICIGDKSDPSPENWRAVPRGLQIAIGCRFPGGLDAAPGNLKPVIVNTALLAHKVSANKGSSTRD